MDYISVKQAAENGAFRNAAYISCAKQTAFPARNASDMYGRFQRTQKSQQIDERKKTGI